MTGDRPGCGWRCPRVRDRVGEGSERIHFSWRFCLLLRADRQSLEMLIPILYLNGISTGDFEDPLIALLGRTPGGLSASTIAAQGPWSADYARWSKRDLSATLRPTSGSTALPCRPGSRTPSQCLLSCMGPRPRARRTRRRSTACARVRNLCGELLSTLSGVARDGA